MKKIQQFNIMAFKYERLANAGFVVEQSTLEAERNEELIALADNECLRAIRRLTGHKFEDGGERVLGELLAYRKSLTKKANSEFNRREIARVNNEVRELLYVPEIVSVVTKDRKNYPELAKNGFMLNGRHYIRLMCSAAMARTNRALFCCEDIYERLDEVLRCGAKDIKIVPAKWNAYYSLMSSATFVVSTPRVCVVKDYEINLVKNVDWAEEHEKQDKIINRDMELPFNIWDGMGLITPELAERWSQEIGYDGIAESFIIRSPFIKGLVATFDFKKFGKEIAKSDKIIDIYGKEYNCNDIDIVLTESQFKLWNAYDSIEQHQEYMDKYGISWGVTKVGGPDGKKVMRTNYQFIQVLNLNDNDIEELCKPTIEWIKGVCGDDYNYKLLYSLGKIAKNTSMEEVWNRVQDNAIKALMLDKDLINDSYLSDSIYRSMQKKMKETYIGKLLVDGGFNFLYCDPYALAEYIFGMTPKGLLKDFSFYAKFWSDKCVNEIIAMRSPLTWRAEVNKLKLECTEEMQEWYKYIPNGVILNMWGNDRDIFSGSDFDGDIIATTNNITFLKSRYGGVPVLYEHKKAQKEFIEK